MQQRSQEVEDMQKKLNATQERLNYSEEKQQEALHVHECSITELDPNSFSHRLGFLMFGVP